MNQTCRRWAGNATYTLCTVLLPTPSPPLYSLQVNLFVQMGDGYGLSIRGGIEHGLGVYVSFVEPGSMAAINGIKVRGGRGTT